MADLEIDDQYDFFREVVLDENGALKVSTSGEMLIGWHVTILIYEAGDFIRR